jgi:hypothetical protein
MKGANAMTIERILTRVLSDLDKAAGFLEERDFALEQRRLDGVADTVQTIRDRIASLRERTEDFLVH